MGRVLGTVALVAVVAAGGTVWLLVREDVGRRRVSNARLLRRLAAASAAAVLVTLVFVRPWPADVILAAAVGGALATVAALVRVLEHRRSPAGWGAIVAALTAVVVGSALVTAGGAALVVDGAALVGGAPAPVAHDGQVLAHPVLYQLFWGPAWAVHPTLPAVSLAVAFERALPSSRWAASVVGAGFGVRSVASGGCWIDPRPPSIGATSSTGGSSGAALASAVDFAAELGPAFGGHRHVVPCAGGEPSVPPARLPADAVVALWLAPSVGNGLGGVSAHGTTPWPGRSHGLVVIGLTGAFARWGTPACGRRPACTAALPPYATPTYALSHELVESATNPFGDGWYADAPLRWSARYLLAHGPSTLLGTAPVFQGEVADLCEPGQPDARRPLVRMLGPSPLPVAPFYRPGRGCGA